MLSLNLSLNSVYRDYMLLIQQYDWFLQANSMANKQKTRNNLGWKKSKRKVKDCVIHQEVVKVARK